MSDNVLQSYQDGTKLIEQSMYSYQSVGMSHRAPESRRTVPSLYNDDPGDDSRIVLGLAPKRFPSCKNFTEVAQASSELVFNEGVKSSSKPSIDERFSYRSFPMFKVSGDSTCSVPKDGNVEASSRGHSFGSRGVSRIHEGTMNYLKDIGDESLALPRPSRGKTAGSNQIVLFKSDKGKAPMSSSFADRLLKHSNNASEFKERVPDASLFHGLSSDNHGNVEGLGFEEDSATFPHSSSRFLGLKKTTSKEKQAFGGTSPGSQFKSRMLSGLLSFPARFGLGQQSKLHLPGGSRESEDNDGVEIVKNFGVQIRNESSAETNTMVMDAFQEQSNLSPSGKNFPSLNMDILAGQDEASEPLGEEVEQRKDFTYLPGLGAELIPSSAPSVASSMDNTGQSSSRTQSLDPEHILSGANQPCNPVSDLVSNGTTYPRPEPGSRWLKRLRVSDPGSFPVAVGTKSSSLGETSHHEKVKPFSNKLVEGSDGTRVKMDDGKESFSLNVVHSSSLALSEKNRDTLLSHSWIRRWWSHNPEASAQKKEPPAEATGEKETTKMERGGDVKNKQFPSIAAMALMGKVMTGFETCEFRRKGSFLVWNAKDI